jgi:hypothetical protein
MVWVSYGTLEDSYRHRLVQFARRQRVRFYVSEYILTELGATLTEKLGLSRRYARLARQQVIRIAKVVRLPPSVRRRVPGDPGMIPSSRRRCRPGPITW